MARLTGAQITVRDWEQRWGREGVWCRTCRHSTPVATLAVDGRAAVLSCECCGALLLRGESWLAEVARRVPQSRAGASTSVR